MTKEGNVRLPPNCGADINEPILYNPYQQAFQEARRKRFCLVCNTIGQMAPDCSFVCAKCRTVHTSNLTAPRVFDNFLLLAGRGSGKTHEGALACLEEMQIPNGIGWVMGPTYKILHDSTFPTLVRRIPPQWVKRWDPEHMEITLKNGHIVAFRSLEDPERARGPHGVCWGWFDEAALSPERAFDVFTPTLTKAGGIVIATTTPAGFDWTYDKLEKPAKEQRKGYFFTTWWSEENPIFRASPVAMRKLAQAKSGMSPELYAQEYRAERKNVTGLVYDYKLLDDLYLANDEAVKKVLPEWPSISPNRQVLIGLDSGADHPFGAVLAVVTEVGIVVIRGYLRRQKAISQHLGAVQMEFGLSPLPPKLLWAANKNEANLRLEFGLRGINIVPAENKHEVGIQRVQSWLYSKQMFFAYTAKDVFDQMHIYRYAQNVAPDGQKKKEQVWKEQDEYPDCIRYMVMAFPELPSPERAVMTDREKARWDALDDQSRADIEAMREYHKQETNKDLQLEEANYPLGDFFSAEAETNLNIW
jgi:phage terminase large subunit